MDFARFGVDLGIEWKLNMVFALQGTRGTGEDQAVRLKVELHAVLGYIRNVDSQEDEIVLVLGRLRRALGPENC